MKNTFYGQDFISINQIKKVDRIKEIFARADYMKSVVENKTIHEPLRGYCVTILFYQPSTRTFSSFSAAARRLGAYVVAIQGMQEYSSVSKGETLEDTIKSIYQTTGADAIVMRHPENTSAEVAASVSAVPIINGGSGKLEHPTQALLDLYTIYQEFGRLDNLKVTMVGDLKYGRTIKSLAMLLAVAGKNNQVTFVAPEELKAPAEFVKPLAKKIKITESGDLSQVLKKSDVIYMTRVQKEWFEAAGKIDEYKRLKLKFIMTRHMASQMPKQSIIMHPLPRVGEIMHEVDDDSHARYFSQMRSGLYVRMALLESILVKEV